MHEMLGISRSLVLVTGITSVAVLLSGCGGGSGGGGNDKPADLKFECSDPPLGVEYVISYYSGTVTCGNLLLESDIGGNQPSWVPPKITFPSAEDGFYTLMYVDPDVDLPEHGSWPDVKTPGSKAPARHWVVGNIDAKMLWTGNFENATIVSAFKGPSPPWGSHRYGQFLFRQGSGKMEFTTLPSPKEIYKWDYKDFISKYNLGPLVASNFHITQHMPARPSSLPASASELSELKFECSYPPLGVAYDIKYYNGTVTCGNLLLESDIGGSHTWWPPKITFPSAKDGFYALMYVDPDADLPGNGSWPDVSTPGSKAPVRHWVVGNIDAKMLQTGNHEFADTVSVYKGPSPAWGSHRYGQFLFRQSTGKINFTKLPSPTGIENWDYQAFINQYKLGPLVASNFHMTQHMDPRKKALKLDRVIV